MTARPGLCPTDDTLAAYGLGKIAGGAADTVVAHLETCPDCRRRVADLSGDSFTDRLRAAAGPKPDSTAEPSKSLTGLSRAVAPAKAPPPELTASGQYADVRELGAGGMGVVYLARNVLMDRDEVLKVVGKGLLARPGAAERFLREIRSAAKLQHPNVVAAYSALQLGDLLVFAMEYAPGDDLAKVVQARGPLPVHVACGYAHHAALGLQHAHERGMVHRDIKPSNLILTKADGKWMVKVLDFGLAKAASEKIADGGQTAHGYLLGTPHFIAPEQARDAGRVDIRADIYALGGTLFFLLTGRPPFSGHDVFEVLRAHQETPPERLDAIRQDVPAGLADAVVRMMAKDPADRFQTPGEVAKVLATFARRVQATLPVGVEEPGKPDTVPVGRRPAWVWPLAVAGVALLAVVAAWAGGAFKTSVKTKAGMLVIESSEPGAEVVIDGEIVKVVWADGGKTAEVSVPPGAHKVEVRKDGFRVVGDEVTVDDGGRQVFRASLVREAKQPVPALADAAQVDDIVRKEADYVSLFNGKDLAGWQATRYSEAWHVEKGILVGRNPFRATVLRTAKEDYKNFHFRIETMLSDGLNGSQNFRQTHQALIGGTKPSELSKAGDLQIGGLLVVDAPNTGIEPNEWFTQEVVAKGRKITVIISGKVVAEYENPGPAATAGPLGLMCRGDSVVRFKRIEVKVLPDE